MDVLRLTLVNYANPLRKGKPPIPVGHYVLTDLLQPHTPVHTFAKTKVYILASRRNGYVLEADNRTPKEIYVNVKAAKLRALRDASESPNRVRFGREYLFWLPHYERLAFFTALNNAQRRAFEAYSSSRGAVIAPSEINYTSCHFVGIRSMMERTPDGKKYFVPRVMGLDFDLDRKKIPDIRSVLTDFRDGELFQEVFNLDEETEKQENLLPAGDAGLAAVVS